MYLAPLQRSVYWRLALLFLLNPLIFFLDIFTDAIFATSCRHSNLTVTNGSLLPGADSDQPWPAEGDADWWMKNGIQNSACGWVDWLSCSQTLFMVGMLLGSLFGGAISDRYGKRPLMLVCLCADSICVLLPAMLPQPLLYLGLRCVTGVCFCCLTTSSFSLAVEWAHPEARLWPSAFLPCCFSIGTMATALLAWLSPTLTKLHLSMSLPQLACLPLFFSIPESPRWLLLKKRMDILERYRNNSPEDKHFLDLVLDSARSSLQKASEVQEKRLPGDLASCDYFHFKHPTVLLRLLIMSYLSAATALTYYGICMNIGSFSVDVFVAQFFSGLSEIPCLLLPLIRMGRRPLTMLTLFLSGAACFLTLLLSRYNKPKLVLSVALLGKLCILGASFITVLYSIELFPTVIRQRCVSLVNLSFRSGCLANSLLFTHPHGMISVAALVVYSSGPIIGSGLCLMLPETSGTQLPDSVEDCDRQSLPILPACVPSVREKDSLHPERSEAKTPHTGLL
ncbi:solute carrier family 22 member 13 isoform X2 [Takifugu flavidus]|uniref:solute carrier family 22 member 13 isoform X2 n=1 Tax=Takifugu flavidus TaxID=433684 RepID=UPI002544637D|nr:solute carrier family 22 member 13 isoform X2 [Takifugu flavidus]